METNAFKLNDQKRENTKLHQKVRMGWFFLFPNKGCFPLHSFAIFARKRTYNV
jgi:hypothetical protein